MATCSTRVSIPSSSTEFVRAQVTRWVGGADPTVYSIDFGFTSSRGTEPTVWYPGDWQVIGARTYARVLVGPDSEANLPEGRYAVWLRLNAAPERPVREIGSLEIS